MTETNIALPEGVTRAISSSTVRYALVYALIDKIIGKQNQKQQK